MIVLDTHVWVWWLSDPDKLPTRARKILSEAAGDRSIYVSSISTWEIALLVSKDRLKFTMETRDWIARSEWDHDGRLVTEATAARSSLWRFRPVKGQAFFHADLPVTGLARFLMRA